MLFLRSRQLTVHKIFIKNLMKTGVTGYIYIELDKRNYAY